MNRSIKFWQWPNILALDAALIAVLWQAALACTLDISLSAVTYLILGFSVWLTYIADRLFDVASREETTLLSDRHRFSKRHATGIWRVWFTVLALDMFLASQLSAGPLKRGALLLVVCLLYTWLNQRLSRRFFPKEVCVALIYTGGVTVFLPERIPIELFGAFAILCLLNCLMIGAKEKAIDSKMHVHSIAPMLSEYWLTPLALLGAGFTLCSGVAAGPGLAISFGLLGLLHYFRRQITVEAYRVMADTVLLVGAAGSLIIKTF